MNIVPFERGWVYDDVLYGNDERIPTRLGESLDVVLVRLQAGDCIAPLEGEDWFSGRLALRAGRWDAEAMWAAMTWSNAADFEDRCPFSLAVAVQAGFGRLPVRGGKWVGFRLDDRLGMVIERWAEVGPG